MSVLEERIAEILKLRLQGKNENEIAESLGIVIPELIKAEEKTGKLIIDAVGRGVRGLEEISQETNLPNSVVSIYASHKGVDIYGDTINRPSTKQRVEAIKYAVQLGAASIDEIAYAVGLHTGTVSQYANIAGIDLPKSINKQPQEKRFAAIRQAVEGGANSVEEVAELAGLGVTRVIIYAREARIDLPAKVYRDESKVYKRRYNREERLAAINQALSEGVKSLEELCRRTHLKPSGLWKFCNENSLALPSDLIPFKYKPELDILIEQGLSLNEIGARTQNTREGVRQYINFSGQYNLWRDARQEVKNAHNEEIQRRQELYRQLITVLEGRVAQLTQNESWAVQMALKREALIEAKPTSVPYKKIVKIFERYERAQRRGKKISLEELGKDISSAAYVGRILERVGVEPMYGSRRESSRYKEKKKAVERLAQIGMPNRDIAYFVGLPEHLPQQHFARRNTKNTAEAFIFSSQLTYRLASRIYEAQDLGFKPNEIAQLLDAREKVVNYAIENRASIKKPIIEALRVVYNDKKYNKPYKT